MTEKGIFRLFTRTSFFALQKNLDRILEIMVWPTSIGGYMGQSVCGSSACKKKEGLNEIDGQGEMVQ